MKKTRLFLSLLALAAVATSCLDDDDSYKQNYTAYCNFEFTDLEYVLGEDSVYFDADYFMGDASLYFYTSHEGSDAFLGGFALSGKHDPVVASGHESSSVLAVCDTTGAANSTGFTVFYQSASMPDHDITFGYANRGECSATLNGMYVCNTNYMANLIVYGTTSIPAFSEGDYLKLRVSSDTGKSDTVTLAEWPAGGTLSYIHDWTAFVTSNVGTYSELNFEFVTNRTDLPLYCCIDGLTSYIQLKF
jgi:hypothetical protein